MALSAEQKSKLVPKVECLICGQVMLRLTRTHLEKHGMTVQEYIEKYGLVASRPKLDGKPVLYLKGGPRNTGLNEESFKEIIDMAEKGYPRKTIAEAVGISYGTLANWIKWGTTWDPNGKMLYAAQYYKFAQEFAAAEARSEMRAVDLIREAGRVDWRAALEFLQRRFPDNWRPESKRILEVDGEVTHKHVKDLEVDKMLEDPEIAHMACTLLERLSEGDREIIDAEVVENDEP